MNSTDNHPGLSLRQAAVTAGVGLLIMTVAAPFAEFFVYGRLVVTGDAETTAQNILANGGLFLSGLFSYLLVFVMDVLVAWALYWLLRPVNRSLSLLAAWFRLVYTALALFAMLKLVTAWHLLHLADGTADLHAQAALQLDAFRQEWGLSLILFGIHLLLIAWLVYRAAYIPRFLGLLLAIAGLGWVVFELAPFLLPGANLRWLFIAFMGETVFMIWLLGWGWRIPERLPDRV